MSQRGVGRKHEFVGLCYVDFGKEASHLQDCPVPVGNGDLVTRLRWSTNRGILRNESEQVDCDATKEA